MQLILEFDDIEPNNAIVVFTATVVAHLFNRLHLMSMEDKRLHMTFSHRMSRGLGCVVARRDNPYEMMIRPQPSWLLLASLSHEMIHLRDLIFGDMKTTEHGILYKGEVTSEAMIHLAQQTQSDNLLPFEREPYMRMYSLADEILHRLPSVLREFAEKQYLRNIEQQGHHVKFPPTLSAYYAEAKAAAATGDHSKFLL